MLVDYGSSDESSNDEVAVSTQPQSATSASNGNAKRQLNGESNVTIMANNEPRKRVKSSLPPLPTKFTDLYSQSSPVNVPALAENKHQGKVRVRPHTEGSWATHVYLQVVLSDNLKEIVHLITEQARLIEPTLQSIVSGTTPIGQGLDQKDNNKKEAKEEEREAATQELHISLTRPIELQQGRIDRFVADLRTTFGSKRAFDISFSGVQHFSNDDGSRSFLSLRVGAGHSEIQLLVNDMNQLVKRYSQPAFYDDPQFHASFASALGGQTLDAHTVAEIKGLEEEIGKEIGGELGHDLRHCSIVVRKLVWKVGNKSGVIPLLL